MKQTDQEYEIESTIQHRHNVNQTLCALQKGIEWERNMTINEHAIYIKEECKHSDPDL